MNRITNTVSTLGEIGIELVTQVGLQVSGDAVRDVCGAFSDVEEKYKDLDRQRLLLRALRNDTQREVRRCRDKETTHSFVLWITEALEVDEKVNDLVTKYEEMQASNQFWLRPSLSSGMEKMMVAIKELRKERSSINVFQLHNPPERVLKVLNAHHIAGYPTLQGALEKVLELVKNSKIKAIGVHGLKGVGKTAIMQNLNNHEDVAKLFDIVIFVSLR